jgi:serine-type D-Ala-D-Ala carboxypeptidase (penicillin-binding protein 5/6)
MRRAPKALAALATAILIALPQAASASVGGPQLDLNGRQVNLGPSASPLPKIKAKSFLLADLDTGQILAAKGAHRQLPPASTLKTLTALAVLRDVPLTKTVKATYKDARQAGSRVGLIPGKQYSVEQLLYALLLPSANDAASALARANGGLRATVAEMNAIAAELQALDTRAMNPSGLDAPGQLSSSYDLALIARAALANDTFRDFVQMKRQTFPTWKGKKQRKQALMEIYTTNRLLLQDYPGALGVKTGFTSKAGNTFIGAAKRKKRTLIVVVMKPVGQTSVAAATLLDWGFENLDKVTPIGTLDVTASGSPVAAEAGVAAASEPEPAPAATILTAAGMQPFGPNQVDAPWWSWALILSITTAFFALMIRSSVRRRRADRMSYSLR